MIRIRQNKATAKALAAILIICTCGLLLTGCIKGTMQLHKQDISKLDNTPAQDSLMASAFAKLCMSGKLSAQEMAENAIQQGWSRANKVSLTKHGLTGIKKQILKIPGGGARVHESQEIFEKRFEENTLHLGIEERFDRDQLVSTQCSVFSQQEILLGVCAAIGNRLSRNPDTNRIYKNSGAHFVSWNASSQDRPVKISCQQAPNSIIQPYEGVAVFLVINQTPQARLRTVTQTTRLQTDDDGR